MPFQFSLESVLRLREEAVERAKDQLAVEMVQMNQAQQQVDEVNAVSYTHLTLPTKA